MDTQGLGSYHALDQSDQIIFCLAMLTSSHFVYNSMNTIDRNAISKLTMISDIAEGLDAGDRQEL